jgi:hypothetical protein
MAGPYPPEYGAGPTGPQMFPPRFAPQSFPEPYPENVGTAYPGMLPPPVGYPKRRRWPVIAAVVLALAVIAAVITAITLSGRDDSTAASGSLSDSSAKAAIQDYLDALSSGDNKKVARHSLCGMFDAVREQRSDLALAKLSSDAFRKQYSSAEVTSIDKVVSWSPHQAQVLFTMKVTPNTGTAGNQRSTDQQAVAQLLSSDGDVLVCSYLPRTAGQY